MLIHFDQHLESLEWFWAVVVAGYVPAVSTPFVNDLDQRRKHLVHLNSLLKRPVVLTNRRLAPEFLGLDELRISTVESLHLRDGNAPGAQHDGAAKAPEDLAVLMLTSGSTGNAKAVCLRHGQMIRAVQGKSQHHDIREGDVFLNWIGLDHVANLTEVHLHAMHLGSEQVHAQAADMLMEPLQFLRLLHKHRAAYTFAPNFFLAALRRALDDAAAGAPEKRQDYELSCLKALISGGEANVVETCAALTKYLYQFHVARDVIRPGFGMTETCAGSIYGLDCPSYDVGARPRVCLAGHVLPGDLHARRRRRRPPDVDGRGGRPAGHRPRGVHRVLQQRRRHRRRLYARRLVHHR